MHLSFVMDFDAFIITIDLRKYDSYHMIKIIGRNFFDLKEISKEDVKKAFKEIEKLPIDENFRHRLNTLMIDELMFVLHKFPEVFQEMERNDLTAIMMDRYVFDSEKIRL